MSVHRRPVVASGDPFDIDGEPSAHGRTSRQLSRNDSLSEENSGTDPTALRAPSRSSLSSLSSATAVKRASVRSPFEDLPPRAFNFYDATVNLPAVLNDPRKSRPTDFLTRTWGEGFVESPVRSSQYLDNFTIEEFRPYMRCINVREAFLKGTRSTPQQWTSSGVSGAKSPQNSWDGPFMDTIPSVFSAQSFSLHDPLVFKEICSFSLTDSETKRRIRGVQDKCGHWLDIVENEIAKNVALRAEAFFSVVENHELLEEKMVVSTARVVSLRGSLKVIGGFVNPVVRTVSLAQKRYHLNQIMRKLQIITTINQTQLTIQMLLANGDFVGALDLISTTRDILSSELAKLHCFRHLSHQLTEMEKFIDNMMSLEFRRALSAHLNRSIDVASEISQRMLDEERFSAIVTGLLRQRRFNVIDWFREEALSSLQATLKFVLISSLSESRNMETEEKEVTDGLITDDNKFVPYHLLEKVSFAGLIRLFHKLREPLKEILLRIRAAHDVTRNLDMEALSQESRAGIFDEGGMTTTDINRLSTQLQELLFAVGEEMQEEVTKILNRCPGWRELRLHNDDLASLWDVLQDIMRNAEAILGIRMTVLNAQLQKLAFAFVGKFHEDRKQKLTLILDSERWTPTEVPVEFQAFAENVIASQTFHVLLPRQRSDSFLNGEDIPKSPSAVVPHLVLSDEFFVVVGTVVILLRMTAEYAALIEKLPSSMNICGDVLQKIVELLKMFNSRTCQLVLGAGAMHSAGLKAITSKNLILASRCLQLVSLFIPVIRDDLAKHLPPKQSHLLRNFDSLLRDIDSHIEEIEKKLLQIFDALLIGNFARWEATVPVPSQTFRTIFSSIKRLYDAVNSMLPQPHLERLFKSLLTLFRRRLKQQISKLNISNDGGPQYGIVTSDISFFTNEMNSLNRLAGLLEDFVDVWER